MNRKLQAAIERACAASIAMNLSACFISTGDDDDGRRATPSTADIDAAGTSEQQPVSYTDEPIDPPPDPFVVELENFVPNSARWAGIDVAVTGVRQIGGRDDEVAASRVASPFLFATPEELEALRRLDPDETYVQLELELTNHRREEADYAEQGTWDLRLANGERIESVDLLDVRILPGNAAKTKLHYPVGRVVDLAGAELVLEGEQRGVLEPEPIPLDQPYVRKFPRRIESLLGQTIEDAVVRVRINEAMWDRNAANVGRAALKKRIVWMNLAVTGMDEYSQFWSAGDTRVSVDGRGIEPFESDSVVAAHNTTHVMWAAFEIDADARMIEVGIPLEEPTELHRFQVDLDASVLAEDPQ